MNAGRAQRTGRALYLETDEEGRFHRHAEIGIHLSDEEALRLARRLLEEKGRRAVLTVDRGPFVDRGGGA